MFELHEKLPVEREQPSIVEAPVEASAVPKVFEVTKPTASQMDIAALLGSKSSLRGAILIREILGPPRGLQALEAL
ncbi:MAG TPA: hypothetical protein VJR49_03400 [Chthoniobacterales bacterium]|nr:hypothetical protein [Chthoniobacterales bacterium]